MTAAELEAGGRIAVRKADVTTLAVDAIINAANSSLLGGGGVDGAIHRAAGPDLVHECRLLGGCKTGQARITGGHRLPAKHIIHTVGPVWNDGGNGEPDLLRQCYQSCFALARRHGLQTLAFPAISCGIYRFPIDRAAVIAVQETAAALAQDDGIKQVVFACFDDAVRHAYRAAIGPA